MALVMKGGGSPVRVWPFGSLHVLLHPTLGVGPRGGVRSCLPGLSGLQGFGDSQLGVIPSPLLSIWVS